MLYLQMVGLIVNRFTYGSLVFFCDMLLQYDTALLIFLDGHSSHCPDTIRLAAKEGVVLFTLHRYHWTKVSFDHLKHRSVPRVQIQSFRTGYNKEFSAVWQNQD